jgi:biopolymer transport protein ExbD
MAMNVGRSRTGVIAEINVTPMADVMIVLLVIFMVMTPILVGPRVLLPEAKNVAERRGQRIEIVVGANGVVSAGEDTLGSIEALGDFLAVKAAGADPPTVLVQADRGVSYADVARVLAACRRAKVPEVALAARRRLDR